jgi:hypothetical protein
MADRKLPNVGHGLFEWNRFVVRSHRNIDTNDPERGAEPSAVSRPGAAEEKASTAPLADLGTEAAKAHSTP